MLSYFMPNVQTANSKGGSSGKVKTEKMYCSFSILSFPVLLPAIEDMNICSASFVYSIFC